MANNEQIKILESGVENWNIWRKKIQLRKVYPKSYSNLEIDSIDLKGANLGGSDLSNADLRNANLSHANLIGTNLSFANLSNANLNNANLIRANLLGVFAIRANFQSANLSHADLIRSDFYDVNLSAANLSEANLWNSKLNNVKLKKTNFNFTRIAHTSFSDCDLTKAENLHKVKHEGKSFIDYHTLQMSENIPINFLKGCGLSEKYIKGYQELMTEAIYYNCFISYSTKDEAFANKLFNYLQGKGVTAWFAPKHIKAGQKIHEQIKKGIHDNEKLLVILSEHSINSDWVKTEIGEAFKKGKELGTQVLFPISLLPFEKLKEWENFDADFAKDLAKEIREFYLPNFANWENPVEYQKSFDKLVESLRIENEK